MESRDVKKLMVKTSALVQNAVSDLDSVSQTTATLHESLKTLATFLDETNLQELSPIDGAKLKEISLAVKALSDETKKVAQDFKDTGFYV